MAQISYQELEKLASIIVARIQDEFSVKKMSGNLAKTVQVAAHADRIEVIIPAKTYSMLMYQTRGVIVPTWHGSYASKLDEEGSEFYVYPHGSRKGSYKISPKNHKGFIDRVINDAIREWLTANPTKYQEKKRTDTGG